MADFDLDARLDRLATRRKGTDIPISLYDSVSKGVTASFEERVKLQNLTETWEVLSSERSIKYALGAMQEVDSRYTKISNDTAEEIQQKLEPRLLRNHGIQTEFCLQGSVPLNIHIKGVSDVDILVLNKIHACSESNLELLRDHNIAVLKDIRSACTTELKQAYPAVYLDTTGAKSLKLTKGDTFPRDVDIVPSHWVETHEYIESRYPYTKGINILDNRTPTTIMNLPFKHIRLIRTRCHKTGGGLRKAIRLCKTLKADLIQEGHDIHLNSFDLASIMYHADTNNLLRGKDHALAVVLEAQRFFRLLLDDPRTRAIKRTPDQTRLIFNHQKKIESLEIMCESLDTLIQRMCKEKRLFKDIQLRNLKYSI